MNSEKQRNLWHICRAAIEILEDRRLLAGQVSFTGPVNFDAGTTPYGIAVAALQNGGPEDILVANTDFSQANAGEVSVLAGDGTGNFSAPIGYFVGNDPSSLAVGDFNEDGNLDLSVTNTHAGTNVLFGDGSGNLTLPANQHFGLGNAGSIFVADFNGDHHQDMAVSGGESGLSVLLGNGSGGFSAPVQVGSDAFYESIAGADFNGDGIEDLACTKGVINDHVDATVDIFFGDGSGGFSAPTTFTAGTSPQSVTAGDFNHDGHVDLAFPNEENTVSVLFGDGSGGFAAPVYFATGAGARAIVSDDFNGDGNPDLAVVNTDDDTVSILLGNGVGGFAAPVNFATGDTPWALASGNLNGDGRPDLAVANYEGKVSVLLNSTSQLIQTNTTLVASSSSIVEGNNVVFTATVSPLGSPLETGTVSFVDNGLTLGTAPIQANGLASFTTAGLAVGVHNISASYNGDGTYFASASGALSVSVSATPPSPVVAFLNRPIFPLPAIAGQKYSARLPIVLTDAGPAISGLFKIDVFADLSVELDSSQVLLFSTTKNYSMKANAGKSFTANIRTLPLAFPAGTYYMLVRVTDPNGATSVYESVQLMFVAAPVVDLVVTSQSETFVSSQAAGDKGGISFTITNNGNIPARGAVDLNLYLAGSTGSTFAFTFKPATVPLNLPVGKSKSVKVRTAIPEGVPADSYVVSGGFTVVAPLTDLNAADNLVDFSTVPIAVGASPVLGTLFTNFISTSHQAAGGSLAEEGSVTVPGDFSADYSFFETSGAIEWQVITSALFGNSYSFFTNQVTLFHPITTFDGKSLILLKSKQGATGSFVISEGTSQANNLAPGTYFFKLS